MIQRFLNFISQNNLIATADKVLLTVSGGVDSVVLAHLFYCAKINFAIAHCNFQLREIDSDLDEQFVKELAEKYKAEFYSVRFETEKYKTKQGISIQMAARELRYTWFNEIVDKYKFNLIATAHHANDQAETIIFNLTKGTGLKGVRGMKPQNGNLIRPLLFASRTEIECYIKENNIIWREDISNASTKYSRNAIRHKVVPELERINPNFIDSMNRFANKMSSLEKMLAEQIGIWKSKIVKIESNVVYIDLKPLQTIDYKSLVLYEILNEYGFQNIEEILLSSCSFSGKKFVSKNFDLVVDRDQLVITIISETNHFYIEFDDKVLALTTPYGEFSLSQKSNFEVKDLEKSNNIAYLNIENLKIPLVLRTWQNGDSIKPMGMDGKSKKISDILIDAKVPLNLKKNKLVLEINNEIVWLVGHTISESYKIKTTVANCLVIRYDKN